jgi:hypothetical protein
VAPASGSLSLATVIEQGEYNASFFRSSNRLRTCSCSQKRHHSEAFGFCCDMPEH